MLKFFRKYNKIILIVGCAVLMVAFLIPQAVSMFSPQPGQRVVGTMAGEAIRVSDLESAYSQMQVLGALGIPQTLLAEDREAWLMTIKDAERLGLGVSASEVNAVLQTLDLSGANLEARADRMNVPSGYLRKSVSDWLLAERYRMLVTGRRYDAGAGLSASPGVTTLSMWALEVQPLLRQIQEANLPQMLERVVAEFGVLRAGQGRISPAATQHFAKNRLERVGGRVAMLEPTVSEDASVSEAELERLFEEYKEFLPGEGAPYPFGYRQPPRVKLEVLSFPAQAALDQATVEPLDVLSFYRANRERFVDGSTGEAPEMPTAEVSAQIEQMIKAEQAQDLVRRALSEARAALDADVRSFPTEDGYRVLPAGFEPVSMAVVAERVSSEAGLVPEVLVTEDWVALDDLFEAMPGFASSRLGNANAGALQVLNLSRELQDEGANPPLRVQAGVMGPALLGMDGTAYLPRIVAAERAAVPASLEQVRLEVAADARRVQAFEQLASQTSGLVEMAASEGLFALAEEYGTVPETVPPMPRRDEGVPTADGQSPAPTLPGVGRSRALVDAAFEAVEGRGVSGEISETLPASERIVAVPVDRRLGVAVFEATRYEEATRSAYETYLRESGRIATDFPLLGGVTVMSPLRREGLAGRLGFDLDDDDDELPADESDDAEAADDPEEAAASEGDAAAG